MSSLFDIICVHSGVIIFSCISTYTFIKCISCGDFAEVFEDSESCFDRVNTDTEEANIKLIEQK